MRLIGTALLAGTVAIWSARSFVPAEIELPPIQQIAAAGVVAGVIVDANGAGMRGVRVDLWRSAAAIRKTTTNAARH